jgi:hypothetical protein
VQSDHVARLTLFAQKSSPGAETPLIEPGGIVQRRYSLLGRATGCLRFSPLRVDCRFVDRIAQTCEIWAARLDRRGQIWVGSYSCTERGFERRQPLRTGARPRPHDARGRRLFPDRVQSAS